MLGPYLLGLILLAAEAPPAGDAAKRRACVKAVDSSPGIVDALFVGATEEPPDDLEGGQTEATQCLRWSGGDVKQCAKVNAPGARKRTGAAVRLCVTWPDALVECLGDLKRLETPACRREWERFRGLVNADPLAEGPSPRWQLELPDTVHDAIAMPDGSIIASSKPQVFAVRAGKVAWGRRVKTRALVAAPDIGCVLVFWGSRLACLDPTSGQERWGVVHPDAQGEMSSEETTFLAAARAGAETVLLDQGGHMFVLRPRACAAGAPGCLVRSGKLRSGFSVSADLRILPSGDRVANDMNYMFLADSDGKEYAEIWFHMGDHLAVEKTGGLLFAYERPVDPKCINTTCKMANVLVRFEPRKCKKGVRGAPLEACQGVVIGMPDRYDDFTSAPIRLPDGDLIVGATKLVRWGKIRWKAALGWLSAPLLVGDRLYVAARAGERGKLELRVVDIATGRTLERSWVPGGGGKDKPVLRRVDDLLYLFADKLYAYPIAQKDHSRGLRSP